jgi:hypothetical protein
MPVFAAFGWAGQDQAIKYALSQLEMFINRLHGDIPHELRAFFPYAGIDRANNLVYLAADAEDVEKDLHVVFYARPLAFQISLGLSDKGKLRQMFNRADDSFAQFYQTLASLEPVWELHVRQMEITDEDSEERAFYQDLYKGPLGELSAEAAKEMVSRAAYLNSEPKWATPFTLSFRMASEQIAVMGTQVVRFVMDRLDQLVPVLRAITGQSGRPPAARPKPTSGDDTIEGVPEATPVAEGPVAVADFVYHAELKPLHIRRGFINLTSEHWPFFAISSRTEIRDDVTLRYGEKLDKKSSVWRLMPSEQARIVLSDNGQRWLERTFLPGQHVEVAAFKSDEDEILITLTPVH